MTLLNDLLNIIKTNSITDYITSIVIILIFTVLGPLLSTFVINLLHIKEKKLSKIKRHAFYKPFKNFVTILGIYIALNTLILPHDMVVFIDKSFRILVIIILSSALSNLFNSHNYEPIKKLINFTGNDALLGFITKFIKILIYIITGFIIINELGYDLSGLVAGLGIFSAVIALAAQDLAKNIIAGCSIITDKPFDIGDYVEINSLTGTVEDITFRSIRVRNTENQVIVIPNSKVADSILINYTKMKKRRFLLELTLELDTQLPNVLSLLEKIKLLLLENENVLKDNIKVFFKTISSNGIDIVIDFYTDIIDYMTYLQYKQEMNYEILNLIKQEKVELAYNTQTLYVKNT